MGLSNLKHRLFIHALFDSNGNQTQAYLSVYKNCQPTSARVCASKLLTKDNIKNEINKIFRRKEPILDSVVKSLSNELEAIKPKVINSKINYFPDNQTRIKAIKICLKLHGII